MGGATDFKVGYKTGFASGAREKKFLYPHFSKCGRTSKQISVGAIEYIEICCLVVTLINIGRPRPMVYYESGKDRDSLVMARLVS